MKHFFLFFYCLFISCMLIQPCFSQVHNKIKYIIDSSQVSAEDEDYETHVYKYKDSIIRYIRLYPHSGKLHYEFVKVDNGKYYYSEYDTLAHKVLSGIALLELKPFRIIHNRLMDSMGKFVNSTSTWNFYKFCKEGEWTESIDSNLSISGNYIHGKRNGMWILWKNEMPEKQYSYCNGKLEDSVSINKAQDSNSVKKLLCKTWFMWKTSETPTNYFVSSSSFSDPYFIFNPNNTFQFHHIEVPHDKGFSGTWLMEASIVTLSKFHGEKLCFKIEYITEKSLVVTFINCQ